jgi:HAD superfamily hydrolase (TIGR01490 family)
MRKLAIFDFDGTLFTGETIPFLLKQYGKLGYSKLEQGKVYLELMVLLMKYKFGKNVDKEAFRGTATRMFLKVFKNMPEKEITLFFKQNIPEIMHHLNPNVVEELHRVKKEGYETILLSGCFTEVLETLSHTLNIETYLGTELIYLPGGKGLDYQSEFKIISGINKVEKLKAYIGNTEVDWVNSYAYGDSYYDLGVLNLVGHPVAVKPDNKLLEVAIEKKWHII